MSHILVSLLLGYTNLRDNELQRYDDESHGAGYDSITSISDVSFSKYFWSKTIFKKNCLFRIIFGYFELYFALYLLSFRSMAPVSVKIMSHLTITIIPLLAQISIWMILLPVLKELEFSDEITSACSCATCVPNETVIVTTSDSLSLRLKTFQLLDFSNFSIFPTTLSNFSFLRVIARVKYLMPVSFFDSLYCSQ